MSQIERFSRNPSNILNRFQEIRKNRNADNPILLPEQIPIIVRSQEDMVQLFGIAQEAWNAIFDLGTTYSIVEAMHHEDEIPLDPEFKEEGIAYLNKMRKYGLILKSAYLMFDDRHYAPPPHYAVMKTLGDLNDDFNRPDKKEHTARVLNALEEYRDYFPQMDFVPGSVEDYQDQYSSVLAAAEENLGKKKLKSKKFHMLRQGVRNIMNVYQLAAVREDDPDVLNTFQFLCGLNKDMGKAHDEVIQKDIWGGVPYSESKIKLKDTIKERIADFIQIHLDKE